MANAVVYAGVIIVLIAIVGGLFVLSGHGTQQAPSTTTIAGSPTTTISQGSPMQASHPVVMTDPGQFPAGTNAAVMTYSQMQVWASGNGASGSGWVTVQGSGSVNLTAIQNGSGQVVGYAGLTANATVEAVNTPSPRLI